MQELIVLRTDMMAAGRLAQSSRTCKQLAQQERLCAIVEAKRKELIEVAGKEHKPGSRSAAVFVHFERLNTARPIRYRCWSWCSSSSPSSPSPCAITLVDNHGRGLPVFSGVPSPALSFDLPLSLT